MNVVITGSTKGIGLGMARAFLERGHSVVISSRGQAAVDKAVADLAQDFPSEKIVGKPCDVVIYDQVRALWDEGIARLGSIDIWVNNAGRESEKQLFHELTPADYVATVDTNLTGVMHCCHVAIGGMHQQGEGKIFNMEGFGSDGRTMAKYAPYGATKYALRYFTKVMIEECKDSPVQVCYLSPGMVVTELLIRPGSENDTDYPRRRKIFNILADKVETVSPWLVDGMLATTKNGEAIRWLTSGKIVSRFAKSLVQKRDILTDMGL